MLCRSIHGSVTQYFSGVSTFIDRVSALFYCGKPEKSLVAHVKLLGLLCPFPLFESNILVPTFKSLSGLFCNDVFWSIVSVWEPGCNCKGLFRQCCYARVWSIHNAILVLYTHVVSKCSPYGN